MAFCLAPSVRSGAARVALAVRLAVPLVAALAGCAQGTPQSPGDDGRVVVLGTFTGEIDPDAGTLTIRDTSAGAASRGPRSSLVIPTSDTTLTIANVGTPVRGAGTGTCAGSEVLTGDVIVTRKYTNAVAGAVYAEITSLSGTGAEACNSSPAPSGTSSTLGLWSYGTLNVSASSVTVPWSFKYTAGQKTTFSGRVIGVLLKGPAGVTITLPVDVDASGIAYARDRVVYPASALKQLVVLDLAEVPQTAIATDVLPGGVAAFVSPTSSSGDLIWFTTKGCASGECKGSDAVGSTYVGVVKGDGSVHYTNASPGVTGLTLQAITVDPNVADGTRAWFVLAGSNGFRSVTFAPATNTFTLGSTVSRTGAAFLAFGPAPSRHLFVTTEAQDVIASYSTATDPPGAVASVSLASTSCAGPRTVVGGPDDRIWFASTGGVAFCNVDAALTAGSVSRVLVTPAAPRGLAVGRSVMGSGEAVWGTYVASPPLPTAVELIHGAPAFFSLILGTAATSASGIGSSPAVAPSTPAQIWVLLPTAGANNYVKRIQPADYP